MLVEDGQERAGKWDVAILDICKTLISLICLAGLMQVFAETEVQA